MKTYCDNVYKWMLHGSNCYIINRPEYNVILRYKLDIRLGEEHYTDVCNIFNPAIKQWYCFTINDAETITIYDKTYNILEIR